MNRESDYIQIDLLKIAEGLIKHIWIVILAMVVCGTAMFSYSAFYIMPRYEASVLLYVNNSSFSVGASSFSISSSEISAAKSLVETYQVILKTRMTLNDVIRLGELNYSYEELCEMIKTESVNDTEVFSVTVNSTDPYEAEHIANMIGRVLPDKIAGIVEGSSVRVVDFAVVPNKKVSPSIGNNTLIGLLIGMLLSSLCIAIKEIIDDRIQSEDYLLQNFGDTPLLSVIPDMLNEKSSGQYYYAKSKTASGKRSRRIPKGGEWIMNSRTESKRSNTDQATNNAMFGANMTFAAKEAYKLLRTNLLFSLPEAVEGRGHIIGVTSSLRGEGKSTTTINLASTLAEQGERVLVIEGDMRLPSLHKKIKIVTRPGLSNVLVTRVDPTAYVQKVVVSYLKDTPITFDVLAAGDIPPNPSELIGSARMKKRIEQLARYYQFILLDLPPVTAVTDALVATKIVDGIIMVVRNGYTDSGSLKEAMRQMKLVDAKMLGFVYTCANNASGGYRTKYKYKYRYYSDYENGR